MIPKIQTCISAINNGVGGVVIDGTKPHAVLHELFTDEALQHINCKMKDLATVKHWIFDLDNTLYSATTNVFGKIDKKMCEFIMENLDVTKQEVKIKNDYFHKHGTTLNGLMKNMILMHIIS